MFVYRSILHEQARPSVIRESRRAPWLAVSVVCFGAFMGQLDASIVTITFPAMERDFSVPVAAVQWVSLIYLLGLIALLAPAGRLGDAVGRKLVYTYGFALALHLGTQSYQAGNHGYAAHHGYPGAEQARPAFIVLAVVAAAAAAIALASRDRRADR